MTEGDDAARTEPGRNWRIVEDLVETTFRGMGEVRNALHCGRLALARLESAGYEVHPSHNLDQVREWIGEAIFDCYETGDRRREAAETQLPRELLSRVAYLIDYGARPAPQAEIDARLHYAPRALRVGLPEDPVRSANVAPPDQSPRGATHRRPVTKPDPARAPESPTNWDPANGHWPPTSSVRRDGPGNGMG